MLPRNYTNDPIFKTSSFFSREISRNSTRLDFGTHYLLQRGFLSRLDSVLLFAEQRELNKHKITYMIPAMHFKYELCTACPTKAWKIDWFLNPHWICLIYHTYTYLLVQLELQFLQQKRGATLVWKDYIWLFQNSLCKELQNRVYLWNPYKSFV